MKVVNPMRADGQRPTSLKKIHGFSCPWGRCYVVGLRDMGVSGKGLLVSVSLGLELVEPTELPAAGCVGKW